MTVAPELPPAPAARRGQDETALVPLARAGRTRRRPPHSAGAVARRSAGVVEGGRGAGPRGLRRVVGRPPADGGWRAGPAVTTWTPDVPLDAVEPAGDGRLRRSAPSHAVGARVVRPARPRLRLTVRGRLLVCLLAGLAALVTLLAVTSRVQALQEPTAPVPASAPAEVVVAPGDTLWSIAERVAPDRDPRGVVDQLRRLNGLPSGDVEAGQRLLLRAP